jgi:FkbM family methyltransferase
MQHRPLNRDRPPRAWPPFDPGGFLDQNAGFVRLSANEAWVVFTRSPIPLKTGTSSLWAVRVDEALRPLGVPQKLVEHGGDARAICRGAQILIFYTTYQRNPAGEIDGSCVVLGEFTVADNIWTCVQLLQMPKQPIGGEASTGAYAGWEKNWLPFLDADLNVALIYSHDPWNVITLKFDDGALPRLDILYRSPSLKWDFGIIRGGTPPILYEDDQLITFYHSSQVTGSKNIYSCGACVFSSKAPYTPIAFTPDPLLLAPYSGGVHRFGWPYAISVIFLNGADRLGQSFRLFGGSDDGELIDYTTSLSELRSRLVPISSVHNDCLHDDRGGTTLLPPNRNLIIPEQARSSPEWPMVRFLRDLLGHGRIFVDVGAYLGGYTIGLAPEFERVLAFEPARLSFRWLKRNVALNNYEHVACHNVALGNAADARPLHVLSGDGYLNTLIPPVDSSAPALESYAVPVQPLDSYNLCEVDLIKIDAPGFEKAVLSGAQETIRQTRPVILIDVQENEARSALQAMLSEMAYSCDFMFPLAPTIALCLAHERRHAFDWFL